MDPISVSPFSSEQENTNGQIPEHPTMNAQIQTNGQTLPSISLTSSQPSQDVHNQTVQITSNQQRITPGLTPTRVGVQRNQQGITTTVNAPTVAVQRTVANTTTQPNSAQTSTVNIPLYAGLNLNAAAQVQQFGTQMPYFNAYGNKNP